MQRIDPVFDWDGEVENVGHKLTPQQVVRLFNMCCHLRDHPVDFIQMAEIKDALANGRDEDALALWDEFTEEEKMVLWIAPTYGGLFTVDERKRLKPQTRRKGRNLERS